MHNLSINLANHKKVLVLADSYDLKKDKVYDIALKGLIEVKRVRGLKFYRRRSKIKLLKS